MNQHHSKKTNKPLYAIAPQKITSTLKLFQHLIIPIRDLTGNRGSAKPSTTICGLSISRHIVRPLLPLLVIFSPSIAQAIPLTSTDVYVLSGSGTAAVKDIKTLNTATGTLSSTLFTTGVTNSAALAIDPIGLKLYYSDRSLLPNNLKRYDGTTESSSLGTFAGSDNVSNPMLRMGFRGSTGYAISNDNTMYTFTTGTTSTITPLGSVSFLGTSPSGLTSSGDIAFDGYGFGWAIFGNSLYRLNLNGTLRQAIPIGQVTVAGSPMVVPTIANSNNGTLVGSIAFDPAGDLYIAGITLVNGTAMGTTIYKVNLDDATATQVGSLISGTVISDFASGNQPLIAPIIKATKTVSPTGSAKPGDTLTYTIVIENTGNAPAVNVDFSDALPAGTTYVANSATLNGTSLAAASYPFTTPYRVNGLNASPGTLKVGAANHATITFKATINTSSVPVSITNQGTVVYLDGTAVPTSSATTTVDSPVSGYKSVKLTNDADSSGTITPGDTLTWTITYKNTSTASVANLQLNDQLPTGVTLTATGGQTVTVSGSGTSATKNSTYTGATTGTVSNLLDTGATLGANGVVTVNIPTTVNSGFTGTLSNQPNATGSSIPGTGTLTDNVDNTSSVPSGVTVPTGSVVQTQNTTIDPTTANVVAPPILPGSVTVSGTVWDDANGNTILTPPEAGTEAGSSTLTIYAIDSSGNVLDKSDVAADGTYTMTLPQNTNGITLRLSNDASKTVGQVAPTTASLPSGWVNTGENKNGTTETTTLGDIAIATTTTSIPNQNFGIEQLPNTTDLTPASQTNPGGTTTVQVPTLAGTDPEDGTLGSGKTFKIVTLPTNGTLTYNNSPVTAGQVISAYDPTLLKLDPNDGALTVSFTYAAVDAAGKEDSTPATVSMAFTATSASCSLQSQLTNPLNLNFGSIPTVIAGTANTPGAVYRFSNVATDVDAFVTLENLQGSNSLVINSLLSNSLGANIRDTPNASYQFKVTLVKAGTNIPIAPINLVVTAFDIDGNPGNTVTDFAGYLNPNGYFVNSPTQIQPSLTVTGVEFTNINTGFNDGTNSPQYAAGAFYFNTNTFTIRGGLKNGSAASSRGQTFIIQTSKLDEFTALDCTTFPRSSVLIYGNVFDDSDGNKIQNGSETAFTSGGLNAVLVDTNNKVIAITPIAADGSYTFNNIPANNNYTVQITTATATVGSAPPAITLPSGWISTGENLMGTADGTIDSKVSVPVTTDNLVGANFGIKTATVSNPNVLLVKRITAINGGTTTVGGDSLVGYIDAPSNTYDDNDITIPTQPTPTDPPKDTDKWHTLSSFMLGGINGGNVKPGDEMEYTIYFLSAGDATASKVLICDRVPSNTTFLPTAFNSFSTKNTSGLPGADRGIIWQYNGATESLTNTSDGDKAEYLAPGVDPTIKYPGIKCDGSNTNGVVVVNLGNLPNATAPGTPVDSYGFIRFRGRVK
jgi:uncharacterized repeat protein (TIGR01451 family)